MEGVSRLIIQKLETMVKDPGMHKTLRSNYKSIGTLFPYAIRLGQGGEQEMINAILLAAKVSWKIVQWRRIAAQVAAVFDESSPPSLDRIIIHISPHVPWHNRELYTKNAVTRWAAAVSAASYSDEIGRSVVDGLLRISEISLPQPHIPVDIWTWLKKRPPLTPVRLRRSYRFSANVASHMQGLGDIEILKLYLLLVWSEWDTHNSDGWFEVDMLTWLGEFDGIETWSYRDDLIKHLDRIQEQLELRLEYFQQQRLEIDEDCIERNKKRYWRVKNALLGAYERAMKTLTRMPLRLILVISVLILVDVSETHSTFACALPLPCP